MTHLDEIKNPKLALRMVDHKDKIERRIAAVHDTQPIAVPIRNYSTRRRAIRPVLGGWGPEERLELWGGE